MFNDRWDGARGRLPTRIGLAVAIALSVLFATACGSNGANPESLVDD